MYPHTIVILLALAISVAVPRSARAADPADGKPVTETQRLRITMLDSVYRFEGRQLDSMDALLHHVRSSKPASIIVSVCAITHEQHVARLQAALAEIHNGFFEIRRLPQKAVECSWSNRSPPPRST